MLAMNETAGGNSGALVQRNCPLCGVQGGQLRWIKGALRIVRCAECGMNFANPVAGEFASGAFYDRLAAPFYLSPDKLESDFAPVRFERELCWFRRFCPAGDVLDVGCSTGAFLHQLNARFPGQYRVTGTDVSGPALEHAASRGLVILRDNFLEHDFGERRFDAITFWAVLEHLVEPRQFLARAAQLLRPGGHLFALVPNLDSLAIRLLGARYRYVMPDHVNYFDAASLRRLIQGESSFKILALGSTHFNPVVIAQDLRRRDERVPDAERAQLLKRTTAWKQNLALVPLRWLYRGLESCLGAVRLADNLIIVAQKDDLPDGEGVSRSNQETFTA